jgi:putative membrane protein
MEKSTAEAAKLSMNDILAMERTSMANERTFLAYIRTSLTLIVPGLTGVEFANSPSLKVVAAMFVPLGVLVILVGAARFYKKRKVTRLLKK